MDLSSIKPGLSFKNYNELCTALAIEPKRGHSKEAQLKEISRYISLKHGSGHSLYIDAVYSVPTTKTDKRFKGLYAEYIELQLLHHLSQTDSSVTYYTKGELYHILGMVNDRYNNESETKTLLAKDDLHMSDINTFYSRSGKELSYLLKKALSSMRARQLIDYHEIYRILENNVLRPATEYETADILAVQNRLLKKYEIDKICFLGRHFSSFYKERNELLYESFGWGACINSLEIIYKKDILIERIPQQELLVYKKLLNSEVKQYLDMKVITEIKQQIKYLEQKQSGNEVAVGTHKSCITFDKERYSQTQKFLNSFFIQL